MKTEKISYLKLAVWILAFAACFLIWPYGMIHKTKTIQTGIEYNHFTEPLSDGVYAVQDFIASEKRLQDITIILDKNSMTSDEGIVQIQLLDAEDTVLCTVEIPVAEISSYQDCTATVDMDLTPGNLYRYSVQALDTQGEGPKLVYRSQARAGIPELGMLSYFGVAQLPDAVSMVRLVYQVGLKWYQIVIYDAFILFLAVLLTNADIWIRKDKR